MSPLPNPNSSERDAQGSDWSSCPPGTLSRYSQAMKSEHQRRQMIRLSRNIGVAVLLVAVGLFSFQSFFDSPTPVFKGGLGCREVISKMDPFFAGRLESRYRVRVLQHLQDCRPCRRKYEAEADLLEVDLAMRARENYAEIATWVNPRPMMGSIIPLLR